MRPANETERLLTGLRDRTSAAFDQGTLSEMFSALEMSIGKSPARSWQDIGRAIMHSRITRLAAAAVLVLAVLLLARHLTGRERTAGPGDGNKAVVQGPQEQDVVTPAVTARDSEPSRLAQELSSAQALFARTDVNGLLRLLDTALDETKIAVAGYLAQLGEEAAVPALQRLADQWQGPVGDNPFLKSIEQIRQASCRREGAGDESLTEEPKPATPTATTGHDPRIMVYVSDKARDAPIPNVEIQTLVHGDGDTESRTHSADEKGAFVLDMNGLTPEYVSITVRPAGYVAQRVTLWDVHKQSLPRTVRFSLEKGTVIGGVVRDKAGRPIEGARVELHGYKPQRESEQPHVSVSITRTTDDQGRWRSAEVPARIDALSFSVTHPKFADNQFSMPRDLKLEDLRAERAVMVLNEGLTVTGRVTDAMGAPIGGAGVLAGTRHYAGQWAETDATGCFRFEPLRVMPLNQTFLLTVQAPGFAPQRRELPADESLEPVEFVLQPARLLIGRVVDSEGKPVEDVFVSADDWNGANTIRWQGKTDRNGMFVWNYPPADAITIYMYKPGYADSRRPVVANDQEQTFVLAGTMTVQGAVTDSQTGEPIGRFKVVPGSRSSNSGLAWWQTSEPWAKWFTGGHYNYTFLSEAQAYAVRIEADGYLPQESGFVDANGHSATIDIALTRGEEEPGPSGYVFDANTSPVAGAQVIWGKSVLIYDGRADVHGRVYTTTDREGHFAFQAADRRDLLATHDGQARLLAVCDQGIGGASYEEFARHGFITLRPWARVQGQWRIGTRLAANQELYLLAYYDKDLPQAGLDRIKAITDENGRFVFERVYPGKFSLCNETFWVEPGQTLELDLGGTGRTVKGELVSPGASDSPIRVGLVLAPVNVPVPFDKIPKPPAYAQMSLEDVRTWLARFNESPEGEAYSDWLSRTYPQVDKRLHVEMDDRSRFHVDNVEPGVYVLRGEIMGPGVYDSRGMSAAPGYGFLLSKPIAFVRHQFEVPPLASDSEMDVPLDLGPVPAREIKPKPKPGDPAPDFDVPTFGPGRIRLADYRGGILLLTFFDEGCINVYPKGHEELKALYRRFHQDGRYAQVSLLSFTNHPLLAKKAVDEAGLTWPHGLLYGGGSKEAREYGKPSKILWNVLIGPQGQILAMGLSGASLERAIERALWTAR